MEAGQQAERQHDGRQRREQVRGYLRLDPEDADFLDGLIAAGVFTSYNDWARYVIRRHRRWMAAGYPARIPLEFSPTQSANPANRVTPPIDTTRLG